MSKTEFPYPTLHHDLPGDFRCYNTGLPIRSLTKKGRCPFCGESMKKAKDHGKFPKTRKKH